jgi:hypothetical protein
MLLPLSMAMVFVTLPTSSPAASAPQIGPLSLKFNDLSATAEATIRPEGLRTAFSFWLEGPGDMLCPVPFGNSCAPVELVGSGHIEAGSEEERVTAPVTSLEPEASYALWVTASNPDGAASSGRYLFVMGARAVEGPIPVPVNEPTPYESKLEPWAAEAAANWAKNQIEVGERERREATERTAREANERATREAEGREGREAVERESAATSSHIAVCTVPRLRGEILGAARRALRHAHCRLGRVSKSGNARSHLVVLGQSASPRHKLANNAAVSVTLGASSKPVSRH